MKKLLITLIIALVSYSTIAQNKITKYCEIESYKPGGWRKLEVRLTENEVDSLFSFKDSTIKINLNKISSFHTVPDALNYMGYLGWSLINATNTPGGLKTFYFKKEFYPSEISK